MALPEMQVNKKRGEKEFMLSWPLTRPKKAKEQRWTKKQHRLRIGEKEGWKNIFPNRGSVERGTLEKEGGWVDEFKGEHVTDARDRETGAIMRLGTTRGNLLGRGRLGTTAQVQLAQGRRNMAEREKGKREPGIKQWRSGHKTCQDGWKRTS